MSQSWAQRGGVTCPGSPSRQCHSRLKPSSLSPKARCFSILGSKHRRQDHLIYQFVDWPKNTVIILANQSVEIFWCEVA